MCLIDARVDDSDLDAHAGVLHAAQRIPGAAGVHQRDGPVQQRPDARQENHAADARQRAQLRFALHRRFHEDRVEQNLRRAHHADLAGSQHAAQGSLCLRDGGPVAEGGLALKLAARGELFRYRGILQNQGIAPRLRRQRKQQKNQNGHTKGKTPHNSLNPIFLRLLGDLAGPAASTGTEFHRVGYFSGTAFFMT